MERKLLNFLVCNTRDSVLKMATDAIQLDHGKFDLFIEQYDNINTSTDNMSCDMLEDFAKLIMLTKEKITDISRGKVDK